MLKESSLENTSVSSIEADKKELIDAITERNGECRKMTNLDIGDGVKGLPRAGLPDMKKSVSMLELSELADIHEFHDAMCFQGDINDPDEEFQIGGIDLDDYDDKIQQKQQQLREDKLEVKSSGVGFRRNMSMVNLRSTPADLDTIKEHGITHTKSVQKTSPPILQRNSSDSTVPKKSAMKRVSSFASFSSMDSVPEAQAPAPRKSSLKRNVSFSNLEIREYPMTLGDNPCVSMGPPVTLSWEHDNTYTVDLEKYEKNREPRRDRHQMIISYYVRKDLIRRAGCSNEELKKMIKSVNKMKNQRQATYALMPVSKVEEALESARRKFKRYVGIKSSTVGS